MEQKHLLDSNVIIGYLAGNIPKRGMKLVSDIINKKPCISVISQIELLRFNDTPENDTLLEKFIKSSEIYPLNPIVVKRTIDLCKQSKIKIPDAIIAATALIENMILIIRNIDDFKNITVLKLLNPWDC